MNDIERITSEVKALSDYVNRDTYNIFVVYEMLRQLSIQVGKLVRVDEEQRRKEEKKGKQYQKDFIDYLESQKKEDEK